MVKTPIMTLLFHIGKIRRLGKQAIYAKAVDFIWLRSCLPLLLNTPA